MEDSGVASFNSSGNVDISLDVLDVSSVNPSDTSAASCCNDSLELSAAGSARAGASDDSGLAQSSISKVEIFTPDQANSELQSFQAQQKQVPIAQLLNKTGYSIVQANGQRRYGPPPDWEGPAPLRGCEVFVGKVPRDCFEDELVPVFERVGKIYEMRLMLDHYSGLNRGYCFVVYCSAAEAKECVRQLNNYEIRKGRTLGICMSVDNCRLFVGGIPKKVTKEDILTEMKKVTEGVTDVIVYPSASDKTKNRGFAFVEYESHRSAAMARRKLMNGRVDLWGHNIAVDWAEPELEVDEEIMAQVKVLYVRNLMLTTSEAQILETFSVHGMVERVKKIKDYAFVHFQTREEAHKAMEAMNGAMLDGAQVEVTLAKPVDKDTYLRSPKLNRPFNVPAFYVPIDQYGSILPFYPSYFSPPNRYMLRNSMGACTMVQVPKASRGVGPTTVRGGGGGGGVFYPMAFSTPTPRFMYPSSPIRATALPFYPSSHQAYYDQPMGVAKRSPDQEGVPAGSMVEMPSTHATGMHTSIKTTKTCTTLLEEICQKNNWGSPIYSLHSSTSTTASGEPDTLFLYKVTVVGIGMQYIPSKLSRNLAEAREMAAEHALIQLGYPMEATGLTGVYSNPRGAIPYADPSPMCPSSFVAIPSPSKPGCSWGTLAAPADHLPAAAIYAPTYAEGLFSPNPAYSPEYYQPGY